MNTNAANQVVIAALFLLVGSSAGATVVRTGTFGGPGGGAFEIDCPAGSVMTGVVVRSGAWLDALSPVCSRWVAGNQTLGEIGPQPSAGGRGGGPGFMRCNGRRGVVTGFDLYQSSNRDRSLGYLTVQCGDFTSPGNRWPLLPGSVGHFGNAKSSDPHRRLICGPNLVAGGIYGKSGAYLDSVGLVCITPVRTAYTPLKPPTGTSHKPTPTPAPPHGHPSLIGPSGGTGSSTSENACLATSKCPPRYKAAYDDGSGLCVCQRE